VQYVVNPVVALVAVLAGLFLLEAGADRLTEAIVALAHRLRAPEHVVGLLTAGGEWEELIVVLLAIVAGHPALAVGNVVGSCIANLIGSMPLGMLGARPLVPDRSARIYAVVMLLVTVVAAALLIDGRVEPIAGGVLVALFVVYVASILLVIQRGWLRPLESDEEDDDGDDESASSARLFATLVVALVVIAVGAELVVEGAVTIAQQLGFSEYAIGATVVAVGTTLPDKAISLIAGRRGQGGVVLANATGSNIFILTLVLGLAALFSGSGLAIAPAVAGVDVPLLVAVSALVVLLVQRPALGRGAGFGLLALYVAYIVFALVRGT
jgi:K+-dependent Na+/Ca+ exchanger-like protein